MHEVDQACELVHENAHEDAMIIFGATIDDSMKDDVKVTVIATGFDQVAAEMASPHLRSISSTSSAAAAAANPAQQQMGQENVSFYRKAAGQTPGGNGGGFPFDDRDDLDIPTFKRKM